MSLKDKIEKTMFTEGLEDRIQDLASLIDTPLEDVKARMKTLSFSDYIKVMSALKSKDSSTIKNMMGLEEQEQLEEAFFLAPWILPALATAVRVGAPALKLLLKGGKKAAPKVKDTTTNMIQKSTASGVIVGAVGKTVYDKVGDAIDGIKNIFGIDMDEDTLNIFAQIVVKYGIPMAAIGAVLYGGKQLKDYMTGEEEKQTGNTTINNYYNGEPATEDVESDIYAQDTWKNDWRKAEEKINKYFDGNEKYLEEIMDHVTSDSYKDETGDDYFWNKHSDIITDNFYGDWTWTEAIQHWDDKDIVKAKSIYQNDFQQTVKPGNSSFDDRRRDSEIMPVVRRTSESEDEDGVSAEDLVDIIMHRIKMNKPLMLALLGDEGPGPLMNAVEDVADFYSGTTEVGSSDVSAMVDAVKRTLFPLDYRKFDSEPYGEAYNPETGLDPNIDTTEWDELIAKAKKKQKEKKYANSKAGKRDPAYRHYHQYKTQEK